MNYLMLDISQLSFFKDKEFYKSMCIGITAALLVPLFLNTISSNIISESQHDADKLFILSGFCIIASIYARNFIQSLSDKIMKQKLEEVTEKIRGVARDVNAMAERETEYEVTLEHPKRPDMIQALDSEITGIKGSEVKGGTEKIKILKSLSESQYTFRSVMGLTKETEISENQILPLINELIALGYIGETIRDRRIRFFITKLGREFLQIHLGQLQE